jgi:hypothetical protein
MIKKRIIISLLLFSVSKVYSCPACWGKYDGEQIDFSKSNQPENINEKVKKYFPQNEDSKTASLNINCKDPKDQKCKKTEDKKDKKTQDVEN